MVVTVVGAGVVGLSIADLLLAAGFQVRILYDRGPLETTSAKASAIWHVYLVDPNDERILRWSERTLRKLVELAREEPESGVFMVKGVELFRGAEIGPPAWAGVPPVFRMLDRREIAVADARWGYEIRAPFAIMPEYLAWLTGRVSARGCEFVEEHVEDVWALAIAEGIVVNAAGLGARDLVSDRTLLGVKGQYLVIAWPDGVGEEYVGFDECPGGMAYVMPRKSDIVIGGTEEYGVEDEAFVLDEGELIGRCASLAPWLSTTSVLVLDRVAGVRPYRPDGVRLDALSVGESGCLINCYGHGGSGFSLSWGCAADVLELVRGEEHKRLANGG